MPQEQRESQQRQTVFTRAMEKPLELITQIVLSGMGVLLFLFVLVWQGKDHIFGTHDADHTLLSTALELAPAVVLTVLSVAIIASPQATVRWFFGIADRAVGKFLPAAKDRRDAAGDS
jgi:hypothetical protein